MFVTKLKVGALLVLGAVGVGTAVYVCGNAAAGQLWPSQGEKLVSKAPAPDEEKEAADRWLKAAQRPGLTAREKEAYEQLAKVHRCAFENVTWTARSFLDLREGSDGPMDVLYRMGFDVLPQLAEALDDDTPTKTVATAYSISFPKGTGGYQKVWRVNELVARLIVELASHDFVFDDEGDYNPPGIRDLNANPRPAADFKKAVLDWYAANRDKTPAERKIADVDDRWFRNRLDAVEWLAEHKSDAGRRAIEKRVDALLVEGKTQENTLLWSEMSACGEALGKIGDKKGLPQVRTVCGFLASDDRWATGGAGPNPNTLLQAFHGLALLGEKDEALRGLKAVFDKRGDRMQPTDVQECLDRAGKW